MKKKRYILIYLLALLSISSVIYGQDYDYEEPFWFSNLPDYEPSDGEYIDPSFKLGFRFSGGYSNYSGFGDNSNVSQVPGTNITVRNLDFKWTLTYDIALVAQFRLGNNWKYQTALGLTELGAYFDKTEYQAPNGSWYPIKKIRSDVWFWENLWGKKFQLREGVDFLIMGGFYLGYDPKAGSYLNTYWPHLKFNDTGTSLTDKGFKSSEAGFGQFDFGAVGMIALDLTGADNYGVQFNLQFNQGIVNIMKGSPSGRNQIVKLGLTFYAGW